MKILIGLTHTLLNRVISNDLEWLWVTKQNIQWHKASHGLSATAEFLVVLILQNWKLSTKLRVTTLQTMWNSLAIPWQFAALLPMLSVTHIMPELELLSVVGVGMQQCMIRNQNKIHKFTKVKNGRKYAAYNIQFYATFPWQDIFHDTSLTFRKIPDISRPAVKFPDISRFSKQMDTLQTVFSNSVTRWLSLRTNCRYSNDRVWLQTTSSTFSTILIANIWCVRQCCCVHLSSACP